jgi:hypothetical protein
MTNDAVEELKRYMVEAGQNQDCEPGAREGEDQSLRSGGKGD